MEFINSITSYLLFQIQTIMKASDLILKPQVLLPDLSLSELLSYPQLHKRVNQRQFQISGIHNLITEMKKSTIDALKQQFIANNNEVDLPKFMWLMSKCLSMTNLLNQSPITRIFYQYQLSYEFVKVFEEIDIDNSKSISWQELIEYMTCSSLTNIEVHNNEHSSQKHSEVSFSHEEKAIFRKNQIKQILELQKHNLLALVEKKSSKLSFIDIAGGHFNKQFELLNIDYNKVLSIDYCQEDRMFGILMTNHMVVFIEDGQMQKNHGQMKFSGDQIEIKYLPLHKSWVLVSLDKTLQIFKPPKGRIQNSNEQQKIRIFRAHDTNIVCIHELKNPLSLCTVAFEAQIKIWSLTANQLLVNLKPNKEEDFIKCKSIKGLDVFNKSMTTYLICWMFSNDISVWLPSSSLSKPYIGSLRGHGGIVEEAKFLTNFPIVVSIDNKNSVRISSIQKMQCLQVWKIEESFCPKIFIFKSIPHLAFYDKLISYYKIQKQQNFHYFNTRKTQVRNSIINNSVLDVSYCSYYDCLIVLMQEQINVLTINTGKIFNRIHAPKKVRFVGMCLKEQRRVFVSTNRNDIYFYRIDDSTLVMKLEPFVTISQAIGKQKRKEQVQNEVGWQIFKMQYNSYNQALLVVAESQKLSQVIVYDYNLGYQPFKIKKISFNQTSLNSFASQNNYFFISSSNPNIITLWNYQNFTLIRTLQLENQVLNLSIQSNFNILAITELNGVRILQLAGLDVNKNFWKSQQSLIKNEFYIQTNEKLANGQIIRTEQVESAKKIKKKVKRKVTFSDQGHKKVMTEQNSEKYCFCVLTAASSLYFLSIDSIIQKLQPTQINSEDKVHPNLIRQEKIIQIHADKYFPSSIQVFNMSSFISEVNSSLKNEIKLFGKVKDMVYTFTCDGLLTFFQKDAFITAKINFPSCEILQWQICYPLIFKVLARIKKVEKMSLDLKLNRQVGQKSDYLKKAFILNKYFREEDIPKLIQFQRQIGKKYQTKSKSNLNFKIKKKEKQEDIYRNFQDKEEQIDKDKQESLSKTNNYFEGMYKNRISKKSNENEKKIEELQKKYTKAFSYIKSKKVQLMNKEKEDEKNNKDKKQITKKKSISHFKIRNSVQMANKNFIEQTKEIMYKNLKVEMLDKL